MVTCSHAQNKQFTDVNFQKNFENDPYELTWPGWTEAV